MCVVDSHTEQDDPEDACGETCLNRLLMIEWLVSTYVHSVSFLSLSQCILGLCLHF